MKKLNFTCRACGVETTSSIRRVPTENLYLDFVTCGECREEDWICNVIDSPPHPDDE